MTVTLETLALQIEVNHQELTKGLNKASKKVDGFAKRTEKSFNLLKAAATSVFGTLFLRSVIRAADAMQQLEFRLISSTGSSIAAGEAMKFLTEMARKQNVNVVDLSDGYVRLLPSVKSGALAMFEMREILALVNDNMKAFGISAASSQRIFFGLSQLLGSGVVTMENLKQVTEHLPGSLNALAKASNRTLGSLIAWVSTGKVTAEMLKGPLLEALKVNEGAAESMGNTYDSAKIQLANTFAEFSKSTEILGIITPAIKAMADAVKLLQNRMEEARQGGRDFADFIDRMFKSDEEILEDRIMDLKHFGDEMEQIIAKTKAQTQATKDQANEQVILNNALALKEQQEKLKPKLEDFERSLMDTRELENTDFEKRLEELGVFLETKLITQQEFNQLELDETARHNDSLSKIKIKEDKKVRTILDGARSDTESKILAFNKRIKDMDVLSSGQRLKVGKDMFMDLLDEAGKHNKKLFQINKAAKIIDTVIFTATAIMRQFAELPLPAAIAASAGIAAMGAIQIASIASQQFQGGASGGGSSPTASAMPSVSTGSSSGGGDAGGGSSEAARGLDVSISGIGADELFSGSQIRSLIDKINDEVEDGALIRGIQIS